MTTLFNDLTGGSPGTDITNANSAAGGNAFDEIDTPANGVDGFIRYGTSHGFPAIHTSTVSSQFERVGWQVNPTAATGPQYAAFYVDPADITGNTYAPIRGMNAASSAQRMEIQISSAGVVTFRNSASAVIWTSAALTSGTRYRIEVMWEGKGTATSAGRVQIFVEEQTTPVQDSGTLIDQNFGGPTQSFWVGQTRTAFSNSGKMSTRVGWSDEAWIGPVTEVVIKPELEVHLGTGIPSQTSVNISQKWSNADGKSFRIVASASSNLASPIYGITTIPDAKNWVKMAITGLTPNMSYYGGVEIDGVVNLDGRFTFKTAPFEGDGRSQSVLFGSCRWNNGGDESFAKMKEMADAGTLMHGKPIFLADLGDRGYPDWGFGGAAVNEDMVLDHLVAQGVWTNIEPLMQAVPSVYMLDNHDSGGDSSDKNGSWKAPVLAAYQRSIPHRTLVDPTNALYHSFDWGRVRYIVVDNRSERDPHTDTEGPNKRKWSQAQEDWFIQQVAEWPWAVCVLGGVFSRHDSAGGQRWGSYSTQFERIHDRLNAVDSLRRLVWLAGDRHALAADLGVSPSTRGVPQAVGAPFEQGSVDLPANEPWDVGGGTSYYNPTPNANMRAFGEASFTDDGGDSIVFNFIGRTADGVARVEMTKTLNVAPRVIWRNSRPWMNPSAGEVEKNVIWLENLKDGSNKTDWDIDGAFPGGNPTVHGFATAMSVNQGGALSLKVHSPNSNWTGKVYRVGWYGGSGAREISTISGPQTSQPTGTVDSTTGMASCANWTANGTWNVPSDTCPGVYFIKIYRNDNPLLSSHIGPFAVRNPARVAPMRVKLSDSTWQAYNHAGANPDNPLAGASIYGTGNSSGFTFNNATRSKAVSYDRPLVNRAFLPQATFWNGEYPFIKWAERLGYDVDYVSTIDVDTDPTILSNSQVVVSSGHDEYQSARVKSAFEDARDAGVHVMWLSANESFWRINPTSPGAREYACWKDSIDGALNPTGVFSGTWQDTRDFNDARRPAALLSGQRFRLNGIAAYAMKANDTHAAIPFWRNTSVAELTSGQEWTSPAHLIGFEGNEPANASSTIESPAGLLRLSEATYAVAGQLSDDNGAFYNQNGNYTHAMTLYKAESGAFVFGAGTNQYAWALDDDHVRYPGISQVSDGLRQALTNLLADLGIQPTEVPAGITMPDPVPLTDYEFPEDTGPVVDFFTFELPPNLNNLNDGNPISVGIRFAVRTSGRWVGNRIYTTTANQGTITASAWNDGTGALLADGSTASAPRSQEVDILFDTPVIVQAGNTYVASSHANLYVASPTSDETWPKDTGRIYTESELPSIAQYVYGATPARPTADSPNNHFHVSPIIEF